MRRINLRFLAILLGATVVFGVLVFFVHRVQTKRSAHDLLARAATEQKKGELVEAEKDYGRYFQINPRDPEALGQYAELIDQMARGDRDKMRVFLTYQQALRESPARDDLRRRFIKVGNELRRTSDVQASLDMLLEKTPNDGELEYEQGLCLAGGGDNAGAAEWYEKARRHKPDLLEAPTRLAGLLRGDLSATPGAAARADQVMDEMVAANKENYKAHALRSRYRRQFKLPGSAEDLQVALKMAPDDPDLVIDAVVEAWTQKKPVEAKRLAEEGIKAHPADLRFYEILARVEYQSNERDAALETLRDALKKNPDQSILRWRLASWLVEKGDSPEFQKQIAMLRDQGFRAEAVDALVATAQVFKGEWAAARTTLERITPLIDNLPELGPRAYFELAICRGKLGDVKGQIAALRRALELNPNWIPVQVALADALGQAGKVDEAITQFRELASNVPAVRTRLAQQLFVRNIRLAPAQRNWKEVDAALTDAEKSGADPLEVASLRANILIANNEFDQARVLLEGIRKKFPDQVGPWIALCELQRIQGKLDQALATLDEAGRLFKNRPEILLQKLQYLSTRGKPDDVKEIHTIADQVASLPDALQTVVLRGVATAFLKLGDVKAAQPLWDDLARRLPNDVYVELICFDLAMQADDDAKVKQVIANLRRIEGEEGTNWRYTEARRLIKLAQAGDQAAEAEARRILVVLSEQRADWPQPSLALAQLDEQEGHTDEAARLYLQAIDLGSRDAEVIRRTASLLFASRRYAEADDVIRKLPAEVPLTGELQRLASSIALQNSDVSRALDLARRGVASNPNDPNEHLWLAQILQSTGDLKQAEAEVRRAAELSPGDGEASVALVQFLMRAGRKDDAAKVTADVVKQTAQAPTNLTAARCFEELGNIEAARRAYDAALAAKPNDSSLLRRACEFEMRAGNNKEAEVRLRRLFTLEGEGVVAADVAWARRTLAVVLTRSDDYQRSREALSLLSPSSSSSSVEALDSESLDDLRARARVLLAQKTFADRKLATRILERVIERAPATSDGDRLLLAVQIYAEQGDWSRAVEQMREVLSRQPNNLNVVADLALMLLKSERTESALPLIDQLERALPKNFNVLDLRVLALKNQGKKDEAAAAVQKFAAQDDSPERVVNLAKLGMMLENLGRYDDAQKFFERYSVESKDPLSVGELAAFFARRGRAADVMRICEQALKTTTVDQVAIFAVPLLYEMKPTPADVERIETWLQESLAKQPDNDSVLATFAQLREYQGRYDDAIALYDKVVGHPNASGQVLSMALNNLGWLLALRGDRSARAVDLVTRAINRNGPNAELLDTRGVAYCAAGDPKNAVVDLDEACKVAPAASKLFHLAHAYHLNDDDNAAAAAWSKAKELGLNANTIHPLEKPVFNELSKLFTK